jgi:hypothetical protein
MAGPPPDDPAWNELAPAQEDGRAAEFETRADGKVVRRDRWEWAIRRIVALLWGNRQEFEMDEVVEAIRELVPSPAEEGDDEDLVHSVQQLLAPAPAAPSLKGALPLGAEEAQRIAAEHFVSYEVVQIIAKAVSAAPSLEQGEALFLVCAGGDGYQAEIVPESKLDDAYLLTQWSSLDDITDLEMSEALEHFHDPEEWLHMDPLRGGKDRVAVEFSLNLEGEWVRVVRLPAIPLASQPAAPVGVKDHEVRNAVADLCAVAVQCHASQQLRALIQGVVFPLLERAGWVPAHQRSLPDQQAAGPGEQ